MCKVTRYLNVNLKQMRDWQMLQLKLENILYYVEALQCQIGSNNISSYTKDTFSLILLHRNLTHCTKPLSVK